MPADPTAVHRAASLRAMLAVVALGLALIVVFAVIVFG
jgi:hypothetical protein